MHVQAVHSITCLWGHAAVSELCCDPFSTATDGEFGLLSLQVTSRQAHVEAGEKMLALERSRMADLHKGIRDLKVRILGYSLCVCVCVCVCVCAHVFACTHAHGSACIPGGVPAPMAVVKPPTLPPAWLAFASHSLLRQGLNGMPCSDPASVPQITLFPPHLDGFIHRAGPAVCGGEEWAGAAGEMRV